jgi:acyl dehydratase
MGHDQRKCNINRPYQEIPLFNTEDWMNEEFEAGKKLRSIRRTISEGESLQFNAFVMDMHPYVADEIFAGIFGRRLVAGAFVLSVVLGLMARSNCDKKGINSCESMRTNIFGI